MFSSFSRTSHRLAVTGSVVGLAGALWAGYLGAFRSVISPDPLPRWTPHGWSWQLMALHYTADAVIALAYLSIAVTLTILYLRERQRAAFAIMFAVFGLLIVTSGATCASDALMAWVPMYWLAGDLKLLTAMCALTTAIVLPDLLPRAHRLIQDALMARRNEQRFLAASNSSRDAFFILESVRDTHARIVDFRFAFVNKPGAALLKSTPEEVTGKLLCESYPINRREGFFDRYKQVVETGESLHRVFPIDDEQINATWLSHQVIKLEDGVAITTTDISAFKANERRLLHLANHDVLTGLATRNLFEERLSAAVEWAAKRNRQMKPSAVGLLVVDCDNFKRLNDLLGHQAGDALLAQFAARVKRCVGPADTVARVGGDEFMVVLADLQDPHEAETVAQRILVGLQEPMDADGHAVQMTASIGVCVYPHDVDCEPAEGGEDRPGSLCAATLLKNADAAMYRAKVEGRNRVQLFTREMASSLNRRRQLDAALQQALAAQEFQLAYQPRVDLSTGRVSGVEALLRWKSRQHGSVSPYEFIPIAEENGLILPMGQWVLEQACREMQQLALTIGRVMPLAVNVSPRQFQQETLAADFYEILQQYRLAPGALEVEITESLLLEESPRSRANLEALQGMGVSIAIDDFGTGYSSMSYLTRFQADRLKIDQSFVRRMSQDGESEAICKAIVGLGKALSMTVVAEGVETSRCRDMLHALGCDEVQGYLYARPMPLAELSAALHTIEFGGLTAVAAA